MSAPLQRVNIGAALTHFPGQTFNGLVDAAEAFRNAGERPLPPLVGRAPQPVVVTIRNDTSEALGAPPSGEDGYWPGVVKLGEPVATPADKEEVALGGPLLAGEEPDGEGTLAIALAPIGTNRPGPAVITGAAWVRILLEGSEEEDYQYACPIAGDVHRLRASASGPAKILWIADTPSEPTYPLSKKALVNIGIHHTQFVAVTEGVPVATWEAGESTDHLVTVYPFFPKPGASGKTTIEFERSIQVVAGLDAEVTVTPGKFKKGIVTDDVLTNVQCTQWDLPEDWEE